MLLLDPTFSTNAAVGLSSCENWHWYPYVVHIEQGNSLSHLRLRCRQGRQAFRARWRFRGGSSGCERACGWGDGFGFGFGFDVDIATCLQRRSKTLDL